MSPLESTAETRAVNNDIDAKRELDLDTSLPSSVLRWTFQLVSAPVNLVLVPTMTWLRWVPSSKGQLQQAEQRVLALPTKQCEVFDVNIGALGDSDNCKIHTIKVPSSKSPPGIPLVLVHGFGCGAAIFAPNLDSLSEKRDVYAIDMVGFGLSTRAALSEDALEAENQMVHSIESWRKEMRLERFVMLGHSLGGFISSAYSLRHSDRVHHLILEEPWGYPEFDPERKSRIPLWGRAIMNSLDYVNALSGVRAAGPAGFNLMKKILGVRHHYMGSFFPETPDTIPEYLYRCNVRRPTGEEFFRHISQKFGWTRHPMLPRMLNEFPLTIKLTFIYGTRTFIARTPSQVLQEKRGSDNVDINVVEDCGHTVHLERLQEFNKIVTETLDRVDPC